MVVVLQINSKTKRIVKWPSILEKVAAGGIEPPTKAL